MRLVIVSLVSALAGGCLSIESKGLSTTTGSTLETPCADGGIRVNGLCQPIGHACGSGTIWAGDTCVTQSCTSDLNFLPCPLADGGLGSCSGGGCFELTSDPKNCGSYGFACPPSTVCIRGSCSFGDGGLVGCVPPHVHGPPPFYYMCALELCTADTENQHCSTWDGGSSGETLYGLCCGGVCVPEDANDCEVCGFKCQDGEVCDAETCTPVEASCTDAGFAGGCSLADNSLGTCCPGGCTDVFSDPRNCGNCASECPTDATCSDGACSRTCADDTDCPTGTGCASTFSGATICLPRHCENLGAGENCVVGDAGRGVCCGGDCVPASSTCGGCQTCEPDQYCGYLGCTPYVDCTTEQPPAFGVADRFACLTDAGASGTCCGSICLDLSDGGRCTAPSRCSAQPMDIGGCLLGQGINGACCGDRCVDLEQDPGNCGWCGNVCASGICEFQQRGTLGSCLPSASSHDCLVSCPDWNTCVQGLCVATLCGGEAFPPEACQAENGTIGVCCDDGVCAHLLDDPQNCGTCGNACRPGDSCVDGSCSGFPGCGLGHLYWYCGDAGDSSQVCCPSAGCTNELSDSANCGYCGNICPPALTCVDGTCT